MNETQLRVANDTFRVVLVAEPETGRQGLQVEVTDADGWRPITVGVNPLVRGRSFNLLADEVESVDARTLRLKGNGVGQGSAGEVPYAWSGQVALDTATGWVRVEVTLDLPQDLELQMVGGIEPEITFDLGPLPPYERGDHVWFKTLIANPTKWNDEAFGNDMPATYYCDPNGHYEVMMFFDMTVMDWMGFENIARFMNYRCGWRRRYKSEPAAEVGLYADGFSGTRLRAGQVKFAYAIRAAARKKPPTDQEAVQMLVEQCLTLLPRTTVWPERATSWDDFARHCLEDLNHPACWHRDARGEFILNYVNAHSPAWAEAIAARGQEFNMLHPCLDSALWILRPLSVWRRVAPGPEKDAFTARLMEMIDRMADANQLGMLNPPRAEEVHGCWQYIYMLIELWQMACSEQRGRIELRVLDELRARTLPLAHRCQYVFPLSFNRATLEKSGSGDGHGIAGMYAEWMLDLHAAYGDAVFLDEARRALRTLYYMPVNTISQEIFLTAHGAHAAQRLAKLDDDPFWLTCAAYLRAQTMRMLYWFDDRTTEATRQVSSLGTFQACCSIIYSAIFENIEVLARLAPGLELEPNPEPWLRVYNLARKTNFYYFPQCLPAEWSSSELKYVPQENIPILEGPVPGKVGQEIYGAGWTFRAHLLWDAWARVEDRELMLLNVNAYEEQEVFEEGRAVSFYLYNPTDETRTAHVEFMLPSGWQELTCESANMNGAEPRVFENSGKPWEVELAPGAWLRLSLR